MHPVYLALLLRVLVEATPARKPFCSKVASRSCRLAATRYCHSYLGHSTETEYLPATTTATEFVYTRTVYEFATENPCLESSRIDKRELLSPQVDAREPNVHARPGGPAPTPPAVLLAERALPPQCLKPYSSAEARSSACSCLATGNPTTTIQSPDETATIEATKTDIVDTFKALRGFDRYVKSTSQNNQFASFICPNCEGIGLFSLSYDYDTGTCALINEYFQYGYNVKSEDRLVKFMNPGTAQVQMDNGVELAPIFCHIYPDYGFRLVCESSVGSYDKTYLTEDDQQIWKMDYIPADEFLLYAEPWSADVPRY